MKNYVDNKCSTIETGRICSGKDFNQLSNEEISKMHKEIAKRREEMRKKYYSSSHNEEKKKKSTLFTLLKTLGK